MTFDLPVHVPQVAAQAVLFVCMNTAGIFISYLSDRAQRQAFLETRRCIEARLRLETENQRQVSPILHFLRDQPAISCFTTFATELTNTGALSREQLTSSRWKLKVFTLPVKLFNISWVDWGRIGLPKLKFFLRGP